MLKPRFWLTLRLKLSKILSWRFSLTSRFSLSKILNSTFSLTSTFYLSKILLTGETVAGFQHKYRRKKYYQNKHDVSPLRNLGSFRCLYGNHCSKIVAVSLCVLNFFFKKKVYIYIYIYVHSYSHSIITFTILQKQNKKKHFHKRL